MPEHQVPGEQHIAVTAQAHRQVTGRPGTDAGSGDEVGGERVGRPLGGDGQLTVRHRGCGVADGQRPASWPGDHFGTQFGDRGRGGEQVGQFTVGGRQAMIGREHEPGGRGPGAGHRHLLTEHGPDQRLRTVDGARHPQTGYCCDRGRQRWIGGQHGIDGDRVGSEIEQPAAARRSRREVGCVVDPDCRWDLLGSSSGVGNVKATVPVPPAQSQRPTVSPTVHVLDAGDHVVAQETQHFVGGERRRRPEAGAPHCPGGTR